ncbi:toprim domain-containing protein [Meiothermus rufus]|uniref:toprim domain-containing protein n=1 Tax=Meiothermus rufus TaxID=604332 RepID=UPI000688CC04|nr:toprim domain-containing protein [Meiothermus rufus]
MAVDLLLSHLANVQAVGHDRWTATCPAHGTGRNQALSIRVLDGKILLHCFAGCAPDAVLEAVGLSWCDLHQGHARPWDYPGYYRPATPERHSTPLEARERWQRWWASATPGHPLLARYLRARGLSITPPPTLRLTLWGEQPVMLARVEGPQGLVGMHLTVLKPDGSGRVGKRLAAGSKPLGCAARLYPLEPGHPLALAEGIETALAVRQATGWPVWACVSAIGLERVQLPPEVGEVLIAADHDPAGLEAAHKLARRLLSEGRRVRLATPPKPGEDWLDAVAGGAA